MSVTSYGVTDVGKARKHNEDAMLDRGEIGLWVVADGMGGHAKGDVASQMIVDAMKKVHEGVKLESYIDDIEERLLEVNQRLIAKARESEKKTTIGSTVVLMLAYENFCVYVWAGDSRLYRLRDKELRQMTTDHSQVEVYVEQGLISREEAAVHPHGNMITRAVGAAEVLYLDMDIQELQSGDRYLLCSDGLTKHTNDIEFQDMLREGTPEECCHAMIAQTLERGAGDNVTAVIIDVN
ncbi:MAG: serine/threonine protein phosphatase PrpC [Planctomycetota bacterium]|jgi:serine/threonine protein phosphatase PrpC